MSTKGRLGGASLAPICLVVTNGQLMDGARQTLMAGCGCAVDAFPGSLCQHIDHITAQSYPLVVVELQPPMTADLAALERLARRGSRGASHVIVIAGGLDEQLTRALLRFNVVDWLPYGFQWDELVAASKRVLEAVKPEAPKNQATIVTFMPAIGGAGASTLAVAELEVLAREHRAERSDCCIVDLNFGTGVIADYLDVPPRLDLSEIVQAPERLDEQLLEVMLSQHRSGYYVLATPPALTAHERTDEQIVGRLLDLAASKFSHIVIDMSSNWAPWTPIIMGGSDKFHLVTEMTVTGLRHARRKAELISTQFGANLASSVIVNKLQWLGNAGLNKKNAQDVLGTFLAGFVPDGGKHVRTAQNQGQLISEAKSSSPLLGALRKLSSVK